MLWSSENPPIRAAREIIRLFANNLDCGRFLVPEKLIRGSILASVAIGETRHGQFHYSRQFADRQGAWSRFDSVAAVRTRDTNTARGPLVDLTSVGGGTTLIEGFVLAQFNAASLILRARQVKRAPEGAPLVPAVQAQQE